MHPLRRDDRRSFAGDLRIMVGLLAHFAFVTSTVPVPVRP